MMTSTESLTSGSLALGTGALHLVSSPGAAADALKVMTPGDQLVLINEGVTALLVADIRKALSAFTLPAEPASGASGPLGAMAEHVALFGIELLPGMQSLSMADLVQQVAACRSSVTWC
jgi:hypothetical protein